MRASVVLAGLFALASCGGDDVQMVTPDSAPPMDATDAMPDAAFTACGQPIASVFVDAWGTAWDRTSRTADTYGVADADCRRTAGMRLPTVAELQRVAAGTPAALPGAASVEALWSSTPTGLSLQETVALGSLRSNGLPPTNGTSLFGFVAREALEEERSYRCVCPATAPAVFDGASCAGPAHDPCFEHGDLRIDAIDRDPANATAAIHECATAGGHVATPDEIVEAIPLGLVGSGTPIRTADRRNSNSAVTVAWTTAGSWMGAFNAEFTHVPAPFRCAGWAHAGTAPDVDVDEWFPLPDGSAVSRQEVPVDSWGAMDKLCRTKNAHLAGSAELARAVGLGLPNGTNAFVWTSDQVGLLSDPPRATYDMTAILAWNATEPRFPYETTASGEVALSPGTWWQYKTSRYGGRCIQYPTTTAPLAAACQGTCHDVTFGPTAIVRIDSESRTADTFAGAIRTCQSLGGRVASSRDLIEAIHDGLPHGSLQTWIWTFDLGGIYPYGTVGPIVFKWDGTGTSDWVDSYDVTMSLDTPDKSWPFRCMWTNEQR